MCSLSGFCLIFLPWMLCFPLYSSTNINHGKNVQTFALEYCSDFSVTSFVLLIEAIDTDQLVPLKVIVLSCCY